MRRKIIHMIQSLDNGGCENMLLRTLPLLSEFDHIIITLKKKGEIASKFKEKNIRVINLKQKSLLDLLSYSRLLKLINKNQPHVILTYLFHADIIGRLFIQSKTTFRVIPFLRTTYNHKKYWLPRLFEKLTYKQVPHYLVNSESVKDFITGIGVNENKITVVPNGIDTKFYDKMPRDKNLSKSLGINAGETVIICVANLHINKGHKYLLEAFEQLYASAPSEKANKKLKLLIVGDGTERINLLKQVEKYSSKSNILFLGKRNDVPKLLKISDIFVLPTLFEGMSNAIMEAMASRLVVITTDISENQELITEGKNGFLISIKNSQEIRNLIEKIIQNRSLIKKLGKNSQETICKKFNLEKIRNNWLSAIK